MLKLFSYSKPHVSHCFRESKLNRCSILIKLCIDYAKGVDCLVLQDVGFPGMVEEQVGLGNNSDTNLEGDRGGGGMSHSLVAKVRMLVSTTYYLLFVNRSGLTPG